MSEKLLPSFNDIHDKTILERVADSLKLDQVLVSPLGRLGYSGARLYRCHAKGGRVYVVKIHVVEKVRREIEAIKSVLAYFSTGNLLTDVFEIDKVAGLVYEYAATTNVDGIHRVRELHEIDLKKNNVTNNGFAALKEVYGVLGKCTQLVDRQTTLCDALAGYLDDDTRGRWKVVLKCMFAKEANNSDLKFLGVSIANPLRFIESKKFNRPLLICSGPVHGDLHPKNVMFDDEGRGRLIDFAWARQDGFPLVDYVLMECSLRFVIFPRFVNIATQIEVDRALLEPDGFERAAKACRFSPLSEEYNTLFEMVRAIRIACTERLGVGEFWQYLAVQFLLMMRQITYPDYQSPTTICAVGQLAKYLKEKWNP